ncbi:MAG TPA: glutathione S-transferase N-terminal domain-containing protein [Thermoleophilaceae bacterium]|nr:glutathione S-transferase N-terminal domain-containing protein [Thermoleophilaceae bacterium]
MAVLYRCNAPTDYICRCGKVARKLQQLGIDYGEVRVPYRRRNRLEVIDLTDQDRVPVLIDGDQVVHESHRIVEYLDWAAAGR